MAVATCDLDALIVVGSEVPPAPTPDPQARLQRTRSVLQTSRSIVRN